MNATAIKKYFESRIKDNAAIYATRLGESPDFLISDGHLMLVQSIVSPVLESRALFPVFPPANQVFTYRKTGHEEKGPSMLDLWKSAIDKSSKPVEVTEWCHGGVEFEGAARVFMFEDGRHIFIDQRFLALLLSKKVELPSYKFYGDHPLAAVVAKYEDEPVALLLPIRRVGDLKYLTEPEHRIVS